MGALSSGAGSRRAGKPRSDNPYDPTTIQGKEWFKGWDKQDAKIKKLKE